ncbi:MAG: AcrB/AcrD/AcrF family protein [Acidobacteriota bacterium]|nr:AcrB/AcrD/AcrF family protein [Acidobacteriota bacterium]
MFLPETYQSALFLMLLSMICWGSWANTLKLCPGYRFQLFYWDYAFGLFAGALLWGLTAGSPGHAEPSFAAAALHAPLQTMLWAACGGVLFNVANLLLVAAIDVAGLAVAFPVGIGLALVIGAVSSYLVSPAGNPLLLFGGVALVAVAIVTDAAAYRKREGSAKAATTRGIVLSLVAGVLMGSFYPLVARAMSAKPASGPYAIALFFAIGVLVSTVPANLLLMARPLDGKPPVDGADYRRAPMGWHVAGVLGGAIWCTGAVANFVASGAHLVGPAVSYSIGQGATMVSACWGVFVWREFAGAPQSARLLLFLMFIFFALGLGAVALAPLY